MNKLKANPADIIVPINVSAFCIGSATTSSTQDFADVRPHFELTPYFDGSSVQGPANVPPITELFRPKEFASLAAPFELETGVHLHWALPAALTRARTTTGDKLAYPAAPNRWRVTRQWVANGAPQSRTWCIESDALSPYNEGDVGTVVPMKPDEAASGKALAPYRTLGLVADEADYREGTASSYLKPFTCVGHGEAAFASLYGQCRNVFGLHDPLDGGAAGAIVSYLVVGWHSDAADDPLLAADADPGLLGWTVPGAAPGRTYYCGHVNQVNPAAASSAVPPADQLSVAVGNTVAEALAALLAPPHSDIDAERILNMLQVGQLVGLDHVATLETVDETLHRAEFGAQDGGQVYTVRRIGDGAARGATRESLLAQANTPSTALSAASAVALDRANTAAAELAGAVRQLKARQRQLFADWVKYLNVTYLSGQSITSASAANFLKSSVSGIEAANSQLALKRERLERSETILKASLRADGGGFEAVVNTAAPFYLAHDPVIAVKGAALAPSRRLQMRRGMLQCFRRADLDVAEDGALHEVLGDYIASNLESAEGLCLSTAWAQPWLPALLQWQCDYAPVLDLQGEAGQYAPNAILEHFHLGDADTELTIKGAWPTLDSASFSVSGTIPVSSQAATPLQMQAKTYLASNPQDTQIRAFVESVANAPFACVAQMAHGLQDGLIQRQQFLQLGVYDPLATDLDDPTPGVAKVVKNSVAQGAAVTDPFSSLRCGTAQFSRLRLVDAFGQYVDLDAKALKPSESLGLKDSADPSLLGLAPRITQALRMDFAFTCPALQIDTNAIPASSPIFGWVLYNHLDDALDLYDVQGRPVGSFSRIGDFWRRPLGSFHAAATGELLVFINAVHQAPDPVSYVDGLIAALDSASKSVSLPGRDGDPALARLVSRAFALATMRAKLEVACDLPAKEDLTAFASLVTGGARDTASLGKVSFPVLLGDPGKGSDGLVGVFRSGAASPAGPVDYGTCYIVDQKAATGKNCLPFDDTTLSLSLENQAKLTVLFDPHGSVSIHSGILPVTAAKLRPEHYAKTLGSLSVTLSIAPWLKAGAPALQAPAIKGFDFSYLSRFEGEWFEQSLNKSSMTNQLPPEPLSAEEAWVLLKPHKNKA